MNKSAAYIFGGEAKIKAMRLFIFNPSSVFSVAEVAKRIKERPSTIKRELKTFIKAGLVKRRAKGFILDASCSHLSAIENFLVDVTPVAEKDIIRKISGTGSVKLVIISGVFLHDKDSRIDVLIVGDRLNQSKIFKAISSIETQFGMELRFTAFDTADFHYRLGIYDKLIRDILDSKHKKILNKLGI